MSTFATKDAVTAWLEEAVDQEARPLAPQSFASAPSAETAPQVISDASQTMPSVDGADADLPASKAATLKIILRNLRDAADSALRLLGDASAGSDLAPMLETTLSLVPAAPAATEGGDRVVEGVFDGEGMVGGDGKAYAVPPNYASKSKLVEGDMLKLTIGHRGNFIYKQIGPIERQRLIGTVGYDQASSQFMVIAGGRTWHVLKASMTYYKSEAGDEAVILVPKNSTSKWAAVENVIKKIPQAS